MPQLTVTSRDGVQHQVEGEGGRSLMETLRRAGFDEVLALCGGSCSCATCHVYVDEAWREATGKPSAMEESMLDFAEEVEPNSRLSCQIRVSDALNGLIVRLPENQH